MVCEFILVHMWNVACADVGMKGTKQKIKIKLVRRENGHEQKAVQHGTK